MMAVMAGEQRLLFEDLPEQEMPPDLSVAYELPSAPAPSGEPARQLPLLSGRQRRRSARGGTAPPPAAAEAATAHVSWPIPARCPVTGTAVCHRDGCYHFHAVDDGRCGHPKAKR